MLRHCTPPAEATCAVSPGSQHCSVLPAPSTQLASSAVFRYTDSGEDDRAANPLSNVAGKFEDALDGGVDNLKHALDRG